MNTKTVIDKSTLQSHRQCPRRAWLEAQGTVQPKYTPSAIAMLEQGKMVHAAARGGCPGAVTIPPELKLADAALRTATTIIAGATTIIEAAFVAGTLGVRVDILQCDSDGVHVTEVKSGSELKDKYLDDAAIQYACLTEAGFKVKSVAISHPSTARTLQEGQHPSSVLVREDVTDMVQWRSLRVIAWLTECADTLSGDEPATAPGAQCADPQPCPFSGHCGTVAKPTETDCAAYLPSKAGPVAECIEAGITTISDMPPGAFTHARNALVREAIMSGRPVVREAFARMLAALPYPRHFLDFETASFAIPQHLGMRPFEPMPFQWSCHTVTTACEAPVHSFFLDTSGADPRRGFAESVLEAVGDAGPILIFSSYEKNRLADLAALFPDLREPLAAVIARLVDLLPLARRGYYAPEQRGSWSIKAILPTLPGAKAAGVTYEGLGEVSDGMAAQAAYMRLVDPTYLGDMNATRQELLDYCAIDTGGLLYFARCVESVATA